MATIVFAILIAASLGLAVMAKKGHHTTSVRDFFIASRQFGGFLSFFSRSARSTASAPSSAFPAASMPKAGPTASGSWAISCSPIRWRISSTR